MKFKIKQVIAHQRKNLKARGFVNPRLSKLSGFRVWVDESGKVASVFNPCKSPRKEPLIYRKRESSNGYQSVSLSGRNFLVHRLIADAYIGSVVGNVVHHKNGLRSDNRRKNLEVVSVSRNNKEGNKTRSKMYGMFINMCLEHFKARNP